MIGAALTAAKVAQAAPKLRALHKACDGIESAFLKQMLGAMHRANDAIKASDELSGGATGEDDYKDMMDTALADRLAARGTLGIAKMTFHATAARALEERAKA